MESPVRICLGAAIVGSLLLLSSTTANGSALHDTTLTAPVKDDRSSRYAKINGTTWVSRSKPKTPDVALNELNPKESVSEEHTDKNAKYKDRGRVRFGAQHLSTTAPKRRGIRTSTNAPKDAPKLMIVTPEPEKKNMSQIIEGMRAYKKTKMPVLVSSSTAPTTVVKKEVSSQEEEYENQSEEEEEERENFHKYTSTKFHDNGNFFTIPGYSEDDDFSQDSIKEGTENKVHKDFSIPSYDKFSTYFPKEISYSSKDDDEPYKSESFFHDFDSELTTPQNEFFDKKFKQISSSIIKKLDSIKTKSPPSNKTNVHKILKENVDVSKLNNGTPHNKSTVIIKNTKEIRLLDNEGAGSANQELSDVHGTSIYYEMSILSTETYAINQSDDDCDNDTLSYESTPSTTNEEELESVKGTVPNVIENKQTLTEKSESLSTSSSSISPISSSVSTVLSTSLNPVSPTVEYTTPTKVNSGSLNRNRTYKRLNFSGTKEPNKIGPNADQVGSNQVYRPVTRRFHYTTPKSRPTWMAPKRNSTRIYQRPTYPTTIYSEHFDISDKFTTTQKPKHPTRTSLTTVPSDIDPVLQSEIGGLKKVVHSPSISDNSIPTLWKRGSTKFGSTSTVTSTEVDESGTKDLEIPPTLTAWALASLRSPPSLASPVVNGSVSTQKSVDENELQKVGEVADKKETTTTSTTTTTTAPTTTGISNELTSKTITEINQNKLQWRPLYSPSSTSSEAHTETTATEAKSERQPAESNISVQSSAESSLSQNSAELVTTEPLLTFRPFNPDISAAELIGLTTNLPSRATITNKTVEEVKENDTILPFKFTKGFESITKLPNGLTTPNGDDVEPVTVKKEQYFPDSNTAFPPTTDYEITTIRFSYIPTIIEESTETTESTENEKITTDFWHPVVPTRTKLTTLGEAPITTYRPQYRTTVDNIEEATTYMPDLTSVEMEVDTKLTETTEKPEAIELQTVSMSEPNTEKNILSEETTQTQDDSTTVAVTEVDTEINSERESSASAFTTNIPETTEKITESALNIIEGESASEENSGSNEVITQQTRPTNPLPTTTKKTSTKLESPTEPATIETTQTVFTTSVEPELVKESTTELQDTKILEVTTDKEESIVESTTDVISTKSVSELEDLTTYNEEVTTQASSRVLTTEEAGSGAAIAIAVSTIGVIALILLVGLLLVVRRRGRRGIYAQRCTPVSLDAYSLDSVSVGHRKGNHRLRASKRSYGNPAYDDEVTSHPMQYAALANFALDTELMTNEFAEIPSVTVRPDEVPPGCEDKNRYSNVLPLPDTRVPLQRIGSDPTTEYINANFITGPGNIRNYYIACQAPLHNTVSDLWRMIWEQNSRLLVMLTEYMENGVEKCYEYLPPSEISDNKRTFGEFQVILKKREQRDKYAISTVQLINLRSRTWREVTHMWYFWPAKGVPDDYDSVIDFLSEMRGFMKISQTAKEYDEEGVEVIYGDQSRSSFHNLSKLRNDDSSSNGNGVNVYSPARAEEQLRRNTATNGTLSRMKVASEVEGVRPCVVVCASGAGRTAAVIALDICARALAAGAVDVPRVVRELRAQRPHSLANRHHYIFVYKVLSEYGNKLMGGGVDTI